MTWTKLGDEFSDATADLSDAAHRTHVDALGWSNRRLLDLTVPKKDLRRFAESDRAAEAVAELIAAGWWEDRGDAWWIGCRFPEWQVERSVIEHRRAVSADTSRRHRMHRAGDHRLCEPARCTALRDQDSDASRDTSRQVSPGTGRDGTGTGSLTVETTKVGEDDDQDEQHDQDEDPRCGWCNAAPARMERSTGRPMIYDRRPWCGVCEPVDPDPPAAGPSCHVGGCAQPATLIDTDGDTPLCPAHEGVAFGATAPLPTGAGGNGTPSGARQHTRQGVGRA